MNVDRHTLFEKLDPPSGGDARFAERLDTSAGRPSRRLRLAVAVFVVVAAAAATLLVSIERQEAVPDTVQLFDSRDLDLLLGRPLEPVPTTVTIDDKPVSVARVQSSDARVRIYTIE